MSPASAHNMREGDDATILNREITAIQELLDEQPDSKCKLSFVVGQILAIDLLIIPGCMESLVYYKRFLLRKHASTLSSVSQTGMRRECNELLSKLQSVDPDRKQRYLELGERLVLTIHCYSLHLANS